MASKLGKKESDLVKRLAEGLDDKVIKQIFPGEKPSDVRAQLARLAGCTAGGNSQMKLPGTGVPMDSCFILHTDGASRGNPGEAGAGACIFDDKGIEVFADRRYLGQCTNNVAEYQALILGLQGAALLKIRELEVRLDSELIVKQLEGQYRVKDAKLKPMYEEAKSLMGVFDSCRAVHVPRAENARADELANQAIDDK